MGLINIAPRILFVVAIALVGLGVIEWVLRPFGFTVVGQAYTPGRLLEFGVGAVVFVAALLLRQIRDELRKAGG